MDHSRAHIHQTTGIGPKLAGSLVTSMGSWRFLIAQTAVVGVWVVCNLWAIVHHWDPYPFILLNLVFSTQAAYASPIILMAGNLQANRDRARDDHEAEEVSMLYALNKRQLEILELLKPS
jgi:uncharacterized membrane protein